MIFKEFEDFMYSKIDYCYKRSKLEIIDKNNTELLLYIKRYSPLCL